MYELTGKNKTTKNWDKLNIFYDKNQFDYMLDTVDRNLYSEAMILEDTYPLPTLRKYQEFKTYESIKLTDHKVKKLNFPRNPQK